MDEYLEGILKNVLPKEKSVKKVPNKNSQLRKLLKGVKTMERMRELNDIFKAAWRSLQYEIAETKKIDLGLKPGSKVKFKTKTRMVHGVILKINRKNARVKETAIHDGVNTPTETGLTWNVAISFLQKEDLL